MPRRPETDLNDFTDERGELIPLGRLVLWAGLDWLIVVQELRQVDGVRVTGLHRGRHGCRPSGHPQG